MTADTAVISGPPATGVVSLLLCPRMGWMPAGRCSGRRPKKKRKTLVDDCPVLSCRLAMIDTGGYVDSSDE